MKDVWVIGAAGQLGAELSSTYGDRVRAFTRHDLDVTADLRAQFDQIAERPRLIFNATAYNAVDQAESDRAACLATNAKAPAAMAKFARDVDADFYHYSTDFVYSGEGDQAWRESDAPRPLNYYAETKLLGERATLEAHPRARVFRTSWVYSHRRQNFVLAVIKRARETGRLTVVDDQIGNPTYAAGLARTSRLIAERPTSPETSGIYNIADLGFTSRLDFAREAIRVAATFEPKLDAVSIDGVPTASLTQTARRPLNTRLNMSKVIETFGVHPTDWRENLRIALRRHYENH